MELIIAARSGMRALLVALHISGATWACGQVGASDHPATVLDPVELLAQRISVADSTRDAVAGAAARLELAALLKPSQALRMTQEAVALLDSADGATELALRAHQELAYRYAAGKTLGKSIKEWEQVVRLTNELRADATAAMEKAQFMNAVASGRIDSLTTALGTERALAKNAMEALVVDQERRYTLSLMAIAGGVVSLLLAVLFFSLHIRRTRAELKELRQEVIWLRMVSKKGVEPTVVAPPVPIAPAPQVELPPVLAPQPVAAPAPTAYDPEEEAMLLALVRRRGEERLQTLRDARSRGDVDKVVRVVHSMKPQLVSLDAPYFTELCGRLVTSDPRTDPAQWSADLDRFEVGMARVIGQQV